MDYIFQKMTQEQAETIAFIWKYENEYSFYNMTADEEDLKDFLNSELRENSHFSVYKDNELIGFFTFNIKEPRIVNIGLGMKPQLVGKGEGLNFLLAGMEYAKNKYSPLFFSLIVAAFNLRAIKVYERAGFIKTETFIQETNGGKYDFIKMLYLVNKDDNI